MPEHTSWFTYITALPGVQSLERSLDGRGVVYPVGTPVTIEYTMLSVFVILLILVAAVITKGRADKVSEAVVPEGKLTVPSFMENFVELFYGMLREALGKEDARVFLPIIGTCAVFIFFSNALGLVPGFAPPTSNLNVTLACGLVVFLTTHIYGLRRNGVAYLKHFLGPVIWLAPLMLPLEIISHIARPLTLGIRLMVNMFVDHLVVSVFAVLFALVLPVPIMLMGILVVCVQTYVFSLLATVYVQMAIEHHDEHGHEVDDGHGRTHLEEAPIAA